MDSVRFGEFACRQTNENKDHRRIELGRCFYLFMRVKLHRYKWAQLRTLGIAIVLCNDMDDFPHTQS